jgi:STE24 endopeptidase
MALAFDPAAATAAYMATLTPAQHATATAYTHGGEWLLLWSWLAGILAAWLILRTGIIARIGTRVRGRNAAVAACVTAYLALDWVIELPWAAYAQWWRERSYGLTKQPLGGWLGENVLSTAISIVMFVLLALAIYALIRRSPRGWWAWSGVVTAAGIVLVAVAGPVVIEPLFNSYTPAPLGPTRSAVVDLAQRAGVPSDRIFVYNGSKQSERYTANVSGLLDTARVAMSDTMFKQGADLAEVRGVVGHEMGHYKHGHVFLSALVTGILAMLMLFVADRAFPGVVRLLRADAATGIADPAAIPVVVVIVTTLILLATPIENTLSRYQESDADRFSLATAHEPDGLSKALVKTIEYRASSPGPVEEAFFYDHPSVERRIRRAMVWKAAHPDLVGR